MDVWRMIHGRYQRGIVTGKPLEMGGSQGRATATGRGVVFCIEEAAPRAGIDLGAATAAVQGFGNVGSSAAHYLEDMGVRVVAISDVTGAVRNPQGIETRKLSQHLARGGALTEFPGVEAMPRDALFGEEVDILVPAALEHAITVDNVESVKARLVAEGANGPTTPQAASVLQSRGCIVIPDILCNAGGVTVSYFEWVQNRQEYYWTAEEVDRRLRDIMKRAYREVADEAARSRCSLREAAYRIAIDRVSAAAARRGVQ
jgi:glutamate dehydrogenase/leucine dehydrogenase